MSTEDVITAPDTVRQPDANDEKAPAEAAIAGGSAEDTDADALGLHRGAIDQTTITTQPPQVVMKQVTLILYDMGLEIQKESAFKYRCVRPRKGASEGAEDLEEASPERASSPDNLFSPVATHFELPEFFTSPTEGPPNILYGPPTEDSLDEVRFSVELTKLAGLKDTYSLDIRRLKGNLKSYSYIYNTIRGRAELNHS